MLAVAEVPERRCFGARQRLSGAPLAGRVGRLSEQAPAGGGTRPTTRRSIAPWRMVKAVARTARRSTCSGSSAPPIVPCRAKNLDRELADAQEDRAVRRLRARRDTPLTCASRPTLTYEGVPRINRSLGEAKRRRCEQAMAFASSPRRLVASECKA